MTQTQSKVEWVYTPPVKPITLKDVYGTDTPEVPKGYEIVDFREPVNYENFIPTDMQFRVGPRLIIARLPEQPKEVPAGYELTGEFRYPRKGESYVIKGYNLAFAYRDHTEDKRWILRPVPTPTLRDIYGTDSPVIPEGWESTGVLRLCKNGDASLDVSGKVSEWHIDPLPGYKNPRLILRKKTEAVKPEPKFKVGDWVKGQIRDEEPYIGQITSSDYLGFVRVDKHACYYASELTPVAAPPAGFKYTKV